MEGDYNQSINDNEFDDDNEPNRLVEALKAELAELQRLIDHDDRETFQEVEQLLHENSMRYIEFEDGQAFVHRVLAILNN